MSFVHVSIRTSDIERSIAFYKGYFGMELEKRRDIHANNAEIAFMKEPGSGFSLELTWYKDQKRFSQASYEDRLFDHLAFTLNDMDATINRMRKAGVKITDEPFTLGPGSSKLAFIEDPDGTLIELIERKG